METPWNGECGRAKTAYGMLGSMIYIKAVAYTFFLGKFYEQHEDGELDAVLRYGDKNVCE